MTILLWVGGGLLIQFVWKWLSNDWDHAAKTSYLGRAGSWAGRHGPGAAQAVSARRTNKGLASRGLALDSHTGKRITEIVDIAHGKDRKPCTVIVCAGAARESAMARVMDALPGWQVNPHQLSKCGLNGQRRHHIFTVRPAGARGGQRGGSTTSTTKKVGMAAATASLLSGTPLDKGEW